MTTSGLLKPPKATGCLSLQSDAILRAAEFQNRPEFHNRNLSPRVHMGGKAPGSASNRHGGVRRIEEYVAVDPDVEPISHRDLDRRLDIQISPCDLRAQL